MSWYFFPRMLSAFIAIVVLVVMTRVLGPAEFGRYNITVLLGTIMFSVTFNWMIVSIGRFYFAEEHEGKTIATVIGAALILALFLVIISVAAHLILPSSWVNSVYYAAVFCVGHAMHEMGAACLRQYNEGAKFAAVTILRHIIGVPLAVTFVLNDGGFEGAVIGMSIGAALTGACALGIAVRRSGVVVPEIKSIKIYFSFGFPLAVVSSTSTYFTMLSQSVLAYLVGIEAVGYFAAAHSLAMRSLRLPMGTLSRVVAPSIFRSYETMGRSSSNRELDRYFSFLALISVPILVALICATDVFTKTLFQPNFAAETSKYLRVLALASFILGLQGAYFSFSFMRSKKTLLQLVITFVMLIVHAILCFSFVIFFGADGASYAFLATSIVSLSAYYYFGQMVDALRLDFRDVTKIVWGALVFAPFGLVSNELTMLPLQAALLVLGFTVMFIVLVCLNQHAAVTVWEKAQSWVN